MAFSEALDILHQAMCVVMYQRIAMAIKMASKVGVCFCPCFICCCPGGHWGITVQVVPQWQHPVAFVIALELLHRAMRLVMHQRSAMAIKMAGG